MHVSPQLCGGYLHVLVIDVVVQCEDNLSETFSAWIRDEESPVAARLTRLIGALTNLSMATAEDLQV